MVFTEIESDFSAEIVRLRLVGGDAFRNGTELNEIEADFSAEIVTFRLVGGMHPPKSATDHYHRVLEEHKWDSKKIWKIVNQSTYNKKRCRTVPSKLINKDGIVITNHRIVADEFNKYFLNVGKSAADLVAPGSSNKSYSNSCVWSSNKASNSIFLFPCSPQEVRNEIAKLKIKKIQRHPTSILNLSNMQILYHPNL